MDSNHISLFDDQVRERAPDPRLWRMPLFDSRNDDA